MDLKHVKIAGGMYEGFTGVYGPYAFEDGRSVKPLTTIQRRRLASALPIKTDDDEPLTLHDRLMSVKDKPLDSEVVAKTPDEVNNARGSEESGPDNSYTKEELEAIAGVKGIEGLRHIGNQVGASGKSINALVKSILSRQAKGHTVDVKEDLEA